MSELWRRSAVELAAMIRDREVSSREVVQAHLDRIEAVNPQLNAIVRLLPDEALAAADTADQVIAGGGMTGPLHGVPCTVKENIDVAGTPTTQAVPALAEAVAPVDAPQVERLRAAGAIPPEDWNLSFQLMAVEGVMARRIADVRAGFTAIAGQHPRDPLSVPAVFTDLSPGERPRIAVLPEPPGGSTHPGVAAAVRRAADALADDGFEVTEAVPPDYEQAIELWGTILAADLGVMKPLLDQIMGEGARQFLGYALEHLAVSDLASWAAANTARHGVARRWSMWYQEYPVLLCPVWSQPAFLLDFDISSLGNAIATLELMRPVLPANLLGTPAAVVPAGMADGLPVGVQVMGARYTDLRCLAIAEMIEQRLGTLTPIDPVAGSPDR
jgi:amidase